MFTILSYISPHVKVPYYLWKVWEGGLMKSITMGMQIAILADEVGMRSVVFISVHSFAVIY